MCEECKEKDIRINERGNWVDLSELPRWEKGERVKEGTINWSKSIGHYIYFKYDEINGKILVKEYIKSTKKIIIDYDNRDYNMHPNSLIKCSLGKILNIFTNEYKYNIGQIINDELKIIDRKNKILNDGIKYKLYKIECLICGFKSDGYYKNGEYKNEYWVVESSLKSGCKCPCCCKSPQIVVPEINSIVTNEETHWMIPYFQGGYEEAKKWNPQSNQKINFKCPNCGKIKNKLRNICDLYKKHSIGCECNDGVSYLFKYVLCTLEQCNATLETEVKYNWNKYKTFNGKLHQANIDIIIYYNDKEIPIECDGEFHRKDNLMNGQSKKESEYIDKQRDNNCLKYLGEETIRISDVGNIKDNILNSKLNSIFDLSKVDWLKCKEFALKNLVKEVCKYWNNKKDWESASDLAKIFNLSTITISKYLKIGNNLKWCKYDVVKESWKGRSKSGNMNGVPIIVYKDGFKIGVYKSASELCRCSFKDLGVYLCQSIISTRIKNNDKMFNKPYNGFIIKCKEDENNQQSA